MSYAKQMLGIFDSEQDFGKILNSVTPLLTNLKGADVDVNKVVASLKGLSASSQGAILSLFKLDKAQLDAIVSASNFGEEETELMLKMAQSEAARTGWSVNRCFFRDIFRSLLRYAPSLTLSVPKNLF